MRITRFHFWGKSLLFFLLLFLGMNSDLQAQQPWKGSELFVYHMVGTPPFANRTPECMKFVSFTSPDLYCPPPPTPPEDPPSPGGGGQSDQGGGIVLDETISSNMMPLPPGGVFDAFDDDIIGLSFYSTNASCTWTSDAATLTVCPAKGSGTIINGFFFEYGVSMTGGGAAGISSPTLRVLVNGVEVFTQTFQSSDRYNGFYAAFPETLNTTLWEGKNVSFEITDVRERIIDDFAIIGTNNCSDNRVCLGNLVWEDTNNDGLRDAGEAGIANVTLQVFRDDGDGNFELPTRDYLFEDDMDGLIAVTTTDANGNYNVCLPEGDYYVRVAPNNFDTGETLEGCFPTLGAATSGNSDIDNQDHGDFKVAYKEYGSVSSVVTLTSGGEPTNDGDDADTNSTIDFGFSCDLSLLMNLGNLVWVDDNQDGLKDNDELGVDDVLVHLYYDENGNGTFDVNDLLVDETRTSGGGIYGFSGLLPGDYLVVIPAINFIPIFGSLAGAEPSPGNDPAPDPDNDLDDTDDGIANSIEPIATRAVTLSFNSEPTSDGDGNNGNLTVDIAVYQEPVCSEYLFVSYSTRFTGEGTAIFDTDGNKIHGVGNFAGAAGDDVSYDYLNNRLYTGSGMTSPRIWHAILDRQPAGGLSVTNVNKGFYNYDPTGGPVNFVYGNFKLAPDGNHYGVNSTTTSSSGFNRIQFDQDGNYYVDELNGASPSINGLAGFTFDDDMNVYFYYGGTIGRSSYLSASDEFISPFEIHSEALPWSPGSGAGTRSYLTYDPVTERIYFTNFLPDFSSAAIYSLPKEFAQDESPRLEWAQSDITLPSNYARGLNVIQYDPYERRIISASYGSTSVPSQGAAFVLNIENDGSLTYDFRFDIPEGANRIFAIPCGGGGETPPPPTGGGLRLGNQVWLDSNKSGTIDAGENGIADVGVVLYKDNGDMIFDRLTDTRWDSTTTDNNGNYLFTGLPDGDYYVLLPNSNFLEGNALHELYSSPPTEADPNTDIDNDDNGINPVMPRSHVNDGVESGKVTLTLESEPTNDGDDNNGNMTVDFGFYQPTIGVDDILRLGNRVWEDANNNICIDAGETFFDGVALTLLKDDGDLLFDAATDVVVATTTTSGGGFYLFDNLLPGNYFVRVDKENFDDGQPLHKYRSSTGYYGANTCFDSKDKGNEVAFYWWVDGILTSYISMEPGEEPPFEVDGDDQNGNMIQDFGFYRPVRLGNRVWHDVNIDGSRDDAEADINNVLVNVYRDNGDGVFSALQDTYVSMRTTIDSGYYNFHDLTQGSYFVEIPSSNFVPGGPLEGFYSTPDHVGEEPPANDTDHGIDNVAPIEGGIVSEIVELTWDMEPEASIDTDNEDGNFTIDFGFNNTCLVDTTSIGVNCRDNNTQQDETDDYIQLTVEATVLGGSGSYVVIVNGVTSSPTASGMSITISGDGQGGNPSLAADGSSTYTVRVQDETDATCFMEFSIGPVDNCSINCTYPTVGSVITSQGTCDNTTGMANNDARVEITGISNADQANIMQGTVYTPGADYGDAANMNVSTGSANFTGLMHNTAYVIRIWNANANCYLDIPFTTPSRDDCVMCVPDQYTICDNGSNSAQLTADAGYSNYIWYEYDLATETKGAQVGTGQTLTITGTDVGPTGTTKCYVYEAEDNAGCDAGLCCPVCITTEECCPTENCFGVQIQVRTRN